MDTAVELDFADGKYLFWLPAPQWLELERKAGSKSIFAIYDGMSGGLGLNGDEPVYLGGSTAMLTEIKETIRLGLIGGNSAKVGGQKIEVGPICARDLVEAYVYPNRPMIESLHLAWAILHAAITGVDLKKKADAPAPKPKRSAKAKSSRTAASSA